MPRSTTIGLTVLVLSTVLSGGAYAAKDPTMHQVYQAAESGRMAEARAMMDQVLRDHPKSGKAHYVEAELLAKQGRLADARTELAKAEALAPGLPFATPSAVQALTARLSGARPAAHVAGQPMRSLAGRQFPWGLVVLGAGFLIVMLVVARLLTRRSAGPALQTGYGSAAPMRGYGPGGTSSVSPMGGGIGSGILGGLATGAAVGAGMVAGEELMHHVLDRNTGNLGTAPLADADEILPQMDDMGGQDFGISDDSWDDGSSLGGDDWS